MKYPIHEEVSRDDVWIYGRTQIEENGRWIDWVKMTPEEFKQATSAKKDVLYNEL